MSSTINCIKKACDQLLLPYRVVDRDGLVLELSLTQRKHVVVNNRIGLLSDAEWFLLRDKWYTYLLFGEEAFFPKTISFIDPHAPLQYYSFIHEQTVLEIIKTIETHFTYPVIIKRNSGTEGRNVFLCRQPQQTLYALESIYSKKQLEYDHVALAQHYIMPANEYRLIVFNSTLEFAYYKPHHRPEFGGRATPLLVTNLAILDSFKKLVTSLDSYYPLRYAGIDVIEETPGNFRVIEINGSPLFTSFITTNGDELVVKLFQKVISYLDTNTL